MHKRTLIYVAVGAVVVIALIVGNRIIANNQNESGNKPVDSAQTNDAETVDPTKPVKRGDVKTPTDNTELINTLNDDASSMDNDLKNYENDDYNDSNLSDKSLYK